MTRDEVKQVFKIVANVYPQFEVTSEKLDIWHDLLSDQPASTVLKNARRHVNENKFPPTVADLRERKQSYDTDILTQIKEWEQNAVPRK